MNANPAKPSREWVDPDDAPEWTEEQFARAEIAEGGVVIEPSTGTLTKGPRNRPAIAQCFALLRRLIRAMGKVGCLALSTACFLSLVVESSVACRFHREDFRETLEKYPTIFSAQVRSAELREFPDTGKGGGGVVIGTYRLKEVFKGNPPQVGKIGTPAWDPNFSCNIYNVAMRVGKEYIFFVRDWSPRMPAAITSGTIGYVDMGATTPLRSVGYEDEREVELRAVIGEKLEHRNERKTR